MDDAPVEGSCENASPSTNLHKTSTNTSSEVKISTSGVSGGWHFHGVPIASVSASLPLACNYRSTGFKIKQKFNLTCINLYTQDIISAEKDNTKLNQSENNDYNMPEDRTQEENFDSETNLISVLMEEIVDKVADIVDGSQVQVLDNNDRPQHKNIIIKEEIIQSDSPPSSNTRIGTENPLKTRKLHELLKPNSRNQIYQFIAS